MTTAFFAYDSASPLRAETMREAGRSLTKRGVPTRTWEDLHTDGKGLIDEVLRAIDASDLVVAEISAMNNNVLFELGYAIASEKKVVLAFDDTDSDANANWRKVGLLSNIGRTDYGGNAERLAGLVHSGAMTNSDLLSTLLVGGPPKDEAGLFAPAPPIRYTAIDVLSKLLERQSALTLHAASEELGIAPLDFYVKTCFRSSAALLHLLGPQRVQSFEHNARASLLAGFAIGFGLPTLMVAESSFSSPLDYKDLLFSYSTASSLTAKVEAWLSELPTDVGTRRKMGRLQLALELPLRSFGQYVAENERNDLDAYYVDTRELHAVIEGEGRIFVGRKGTGKTAAMTQAVAELRRDRANLVVPIKPTAYELSGLLELTNRFDAQHREYALVSTWQYLLFSEIALRAIRLLDEGTGGAGQNTESITLRSLVADLDLSDGDDISVRLEKAIDRLTSEARRAGETNHDFIARNLQLHKLPSLKTALTAVLSKYRRVCLLLDNLDKTWEAGADHTAIAQFILTLLVASGRVETEFARSLGDGTPIQVSLTAFLRTDIFDHVIAGAREPDKISPLHIEWRDEELLERVLVERYAAKRTRARQADPALDLWNEVFAREVKGLPTRDYLFWRALQRPRDLIYFANAALTTAINRKHDRIQESDVVHAETDYSRFAFEALLVEAQAEAFDLEELLYEFVGSGAVLPNDEVVGLLSGTSDAIQARDWLIGSSFLGVEVRPGDYRHVEGGTAAKKQLKLATKMLGVGEQLRFRVHPAFRPHLEIDDSDLHIPEA